MYKIGHLVGDNWVEFSHPPVFKVQEDSGKARRLVAGVPSGSPEVFARLVATLEPPYYVLYVLHTPRGEGHPGRYQSAKLSWGEFQQLVSDYGDFLAKDARFDIWVHSPVEQATIVWDRHDEIFAYGPLDRYEATLKGLGFLAGEVVIPAPHEHHYHAAFDSRAKQLLQWHQWSYSPLRPEDEQ